MEMFLLIETISPNFPKSIVMDAVLSIEISMTNAANINTAKFQFKDLSMAVYCQIMYDEWLKLMEEFFREESSLNYVSVYRVKSQVEDFHNSLSSSFCRPSLTAVSNALDVTSANSADGDITFVHFRKCVFSNKAVVHEIYALAASSVRGGRGAAVEVKAEPVAAGESSPIQEQGDAVAV